MDTSCITIPNKTSILVYRFIIYTDMTLKKFIFNNPNCICTFKNRWRCTYHGLDYSMNVFIAKKLPVPAIVCIVFSKPKPMEEFFPEFERLFGTRPQYKDITYINRVEKFYTPYHGLDFESLYDDLDKSSDISTFFIVEHNKKEKKVKTGKPGKILSYSQVSKYNDDDDSDYEESAKPPPRVNMSGGVGMDDIDPRLSMDLQRFCAMMVQPFPNESNVMIEIFSSGVLNVAGIPDEEYFKRIKKFIEEKLAPILKNNSYDE